MTAGVTASIRVDIDATLTGTNDLGTPKMRAAVEKALEFLPGTDTTGKANVLFTDERTIAASSTENLDLAGALADALGATIAAAEIVAIYIEADDGNTNDVVVGGAGSNTFTGPFADATDKLKVAPGDFHLLTCKRGWTVTASTGDILLVANSSSGSGVTYRIVVIGRTTAA